MYIYIIVTTNQKPTIDTQKTKKPKHNTKEKNKTTGEETKRKKTGKNCKTTRSNKMAISTYLSIIALNISWLNALIKRHRVAKWIKK